jgi:hypothetical protein
LKRLSEGLCIQCGNVRDIVTSQRCIRCRTMRKGKGKVRTYKCGLCGKEGHQRRTCVERFGDATGPGRGTGDPSDAGGVVDNVVRTRSQLRKDCFAAIREVCGEEVCPKVHEADRALQGNPAPNIGLVEVSRTAAHMRWALMAMLSYMSDPSLRRCMNCKMQTNEDATKGHSDRCLVGRLLTMVSEARPR